MNNLNYYGSLFDEDEFELVEEDQQEFTEGDNIVFNEHYIGAKMSVRAKMRLLNKHLLLSDTPTEGTFQLPKVLPYCGKIPDVFVPYCAKVCYNSQYKGIYCHIDDVRFGTAWSHPIAALKKVKQFDVAIAPDNTLWVDALVCENVEQLRRSRTIQRFWQNNGVNTIQTASWGDANSVINYAFDGLAEHSWTSIAHQRVGNKAEQRLFRFAVQTLVERKSPLGLVVFGAPLDFDPGVPVIVKPSFIPRLRKL
jgi:hypothetical protein